MLRQLKLKSSGKDIPGRSNYMKKLILQTESFLKNMRWKTFWSERKGSMDDGEDNNDNRKDITIDFKSTKTPPQHDLLKSFERDTYNLIANIEFRKVNDPGLLKMSQEVKKINDTNNIIVNADKTGNRYEVPVSDYQRLMHDNLTRDCKLDNENKLTKIDSDTKKHASSLEISDRMECHSRSNAILTIKDHKEDFPNTIKCRVINPAGNNLGKVSKRALNKIDSTCREATSVNQWKSTQEVLSWFTLVHANNPTKMKGRFVQFDIFYPSISEELLRSSLDYAKTYTSIDEEEMDKAKCPVGNNCLKANVVYNATVQYENKASTYIGMTENTFKTRYTLHKSSLKHNKNRSQTELSSLIWSLKDSNIPYELTWEIIDQVKPYQPGKWTCNLCLAEKFHILMGEHLINKKTELLNKCPHRRRFLACNLKP